MIVFTPYHPSSFPISLDTVGPLSEGKTSNTLFRFRSWTLMKMWSLFFASMTPRQSIAMSIIFSRFHSSCIEVLFAMRIAEDLSTSSIIFSLFARIVVPVSVLSIIASTSSGGLASVAPKERNILTFELEPQVCHGVITWGIASPQYCLYAGLFIRYAIVVLMY